MANRLHVRRGDSVVVIAGKDKGREGEIIKVIPDESRVVVRGVNMAKKHMKSSAQNSQGGIIEKEVSIHVSNVMHKDPETGKPTRIGHKFLQDGSKVRFAIKSGSTIENN